MRFGHTLRATFSAAGSRRFLSLALATSAVTLAGYAFVGAPSVAQAYPQPSVYPTSWELDFTYETPRRIVVEVPGERSPKAYWYMTYSATNNTNSEQIYLPRFEMVTKDGKVLRSDREASPTVFDAIARKERAKPIQPALKLQGTILVGEDQAKYGVAIWEEPSPEMGSFTIFVTGMSGETATLTGGDGKPVMDKDGNPLTLRKTKQLDFTVRGDEVYAGDPIQKTGEAWVMR